jgi:hypothetical protein
MNFKEWLNIQEAAPSAATAFAGNKGILRAANIARGPTAQFGTGQDNPLDPKALAKRGYAGTVGAIGSQFQKAMYGADPSSAPTPVSQFFGDGGVKDEGEWFEATADVPTTSVGDPEAIEALKKQMLEDPSIQELIQSGQIDLRYIDPKHVQLEITRTEGTNSTVKLRLKKSSGRASQWIDKSAQATTPGGADATQPQPQAPAVA